MSAHVLSLLPILVGSLYTEALLVFLGMSLKVLFGYLPLYMWLKLSLSIGFMDTVG